MRPIILYELARTKVDDEQREAERRRRARAIANSRPPTINGPSVFRWVRSLLSRAYPAPSAAAG